MNNNKWLSDEIMHVHDQGQDADREQQEINSGSGEIGKWILIALGLSAFIPGSNGLVAPIGGIILFVALLLTYTGSKHTGGNDTDPPNKGKPWDGQ